MGWKFGSMQLAGWTAVCAFGAMGAAAQRPAVAQGPAAAAQPAVARSAAARGSELSMTPVKPESVGFSSERLSRLHTLIQDEIDQKHLAGAVTILARHGKVVEYRTYGVRDVATGAPMTKDTIFRDYSMTKPVTGVAMMILFEEGKWLPNDPIAKYIPEFAHLKVFNGVDADGKMILADPDHPPTMHELMSHSAGFSYGSGFPPVDALYREKNPMGSKEPAGDDRQARDDSAELPAGQGMDVFAVDGCGRLHRGEAVGAVAAGLHARRTFLRRWG